MTDLNLNGLTDAQLRLFAVRCARRVQHLMRDPSSITALDVAERHAHGQATDEEVEEAAAAAWNATLAVALAAGSAAAKVAASASWAATAAAKGAAWAAGNAADAAASSADADASSSASWTDERAAQQEILKQIREGRE